jgi:hypothetical protein
MKSAASHGLRKYQKHEIGAIAAAFGNGDMFTVIDPNGAETLVALGEKPLLFRGSIAVAGRKRPLRHLVACSQELAATSSDGKLLLVSDDDTFIWSALVSHYGLPATPEWGPGCLPNCGHRNASTLCLGLGTKELRSRERASNYWRCSQEA